MHRRAYRPQAPVSLEDRSLQSGLSDPVVLLHRQLNFIVDHMRNGFFMFERHHDLSQLHDEISEVVVDIPFQRQDGLALSIHRIVDNMVQEIGNHRPGAIRLASDQVTVATIADVAARVRAGDVILR